MKSSPTLRTKISRRAFTLVEVLAAMLVMAIVIPVAMQGMSIASRAGILGTRKAAAMRVAERVLNEQFITGQLTQSTASGSVSEGGGFELLSVDHEVGRLATGCHDPSYREGHLHGAREQLHGERHHAV